MSGYLRELPYLHKSLRKIAASSPDRGVCYSAIEDLVMSSEGIIDMSVFTGSGFRRTTYTINEKKVYIDDVTWKNPSGTYSSYEALNITQRKKQPKKGEKEYVEINMRSSLTVFLKLAIECLMQIRGILQFPRGPDELNMHPSSSTPKRVIHESGVEDDEVVALPSLGMSSQSMGVNRMETEESGDALGPGLRLPRPSVHL